MNNNIAVLGAQSGDEGKGHIVHYLAPNYSWIIRYNGGANAGHTIYRDGKKYVHNLLPSIDFRAARSKAYLGSGMVIDLEKLLEEVVIAEQDFPGAASKIYVDKNAFIVTNQHKLEDKANNAHIGSTNRGIGPAYTDKIGRKGTRITDLLSVKENEYSALLDKLKSLGVKFTSLLEVKSEMLDVSLLFEGAQGVLLDINQGIYPYVSSSDCTLGGIYANGFAFAAPKTIYGVAKCYATKVGEGPFPSEIFGQEAARLRELGKEYGATTGRPRRIGWLDIPALQYACQVSGITHLVLTKLDILAGMEQVPVAIKYQTPVTEAKDFFSASPIYQNFPGWNHCKFANDFSEENLNKFINMISTATGCQISLVSCGTSPNDIYWL
jgi:adenylosuccinate synthase